jgi:hypothetical protein
LALAIVIGVLAVLAFFLLHLAGVPGSFSH